MKRTTNWEQTTAIIRQTVRSLTNLDEQHVIADYTLGSKPTLPFIVVHPSGTISTPVQHLYPMHEPVDTNISITVHSSAQEQALDIMDNLQANLRDPEVHYQVKRQGIIIVGVLDPQDRSAIGINNSEQQYGFDLHIRVERNFESDQPSIDSISYNNINITRN